MGPGVALEHLHNFPLGSIKYSDSESNKTITAEEGQTEVD